MALSIFVMVRSHCMQRWTLAPATSWERPPLAIPAPSLSTFWARSSPVSLRAEEIHIVADNLSAHKTKNVFEFPPGQPNRDQEIHYTPTYSSWLNQVEIWFSKIQRDVIARESSLPQATSPESSFVTSSSITKPHTPFRWSCKNADHRIKPVTQRASDSLH